MAHPLVAPLLAWFDHARRDLPWRSPQGMTRDPYRVWLAEIMLQQTTVAAVMPRFRDFLERWPDVATLAASPLEEVLDRWAGLGYYARARNLHAAARIVAGNGGRFPESPEALVRLPGIGPYTANAIAALAFDRPVLAIDGNVERVFSRLFRIEATGNALKAAIARLACDLVPRDRAGDFSEAVMDLGALICTPRTPLCPRCPLGPLCAARAEGETARFPIKPARKARPVRRTLMFVVMRDGSVLARRRPAGGMLGGMLELPSSPWVAEEAFDAEDAFRHAPGGRDWRALPGRIRHSFTHFHLDIEVMSGTAGTAGKWQDDTLFWLPLASERRLPSAMRKALVHAGALAFRA